MEHVRAFLETKSLLDRKSAMMVMRCQKMVATNAKFLARTSAPNVNDNSCTECNTQAWILRDKDVIKCARTDGIVVGKE